MRRPDWPLRLDQLISEARDKPFEWGSHDCATWACDAVHAVTGVPVWQPWKGTYDTKDGADRVLQSLGYTSLADAVSDTLELLSTPLFAQRGDIVQHKIGALGVCIGSEAMCLMKRGLIAIPVKNCAKAWRV